MTIELDNVIITSIKHRLQFPKRDQKNDVEMLSSMVRNTHDVSGIAFDIIRTQYQIEGARAVLRELGIDVIWNEDGSVTLYSEKDKVQM